MVGPYVSGRNKIASKEIAAMISSTQNVHLQPSAETKPDIIGAAMGPKVVHLGTIRCVHVGFRAEKR